MAIGRPLIVDVLYLRELRVRYPHFFQKYHETQRATIAFQNRSWPLPPGPLVIAPVIPPYPILGLLRALIILLLPSGLSDYAPRLPPPPSHRNQIRVRHKTRVGLRHQTRDSLHLLLCIVYTAISHKSERLAAL